MRVCVRVLFVFARLHGFLANNKINENMPDDGESDVNGAAADV